MATSKLTSSLRKSISAEKKELENKGFSRETATLLPDNSPIMVEDPSETSESSQSAEANLVTEMILGNTTPVWSKQVSQVKGNLDIGIGVQHQLAKLYLENCLSLNDDFSTYLKKISDVHNFTNLYSLNLELLSSLRRKQKTILENHLALLRQFFPLLESIK